MIVLNSEPLGYSKDAIKLWENKGYTYVASNWQNILSRDRFDDVNILIVRLAQKINKSIIDRFPSLTHLVSATTGLDHIDVHLLAEKNIKLVSLRGQDDFLRTIPSTAEHTWALLLSLIRNIPFADRDVRNGYWRRDLFRGVQLKGKTLGIVGMGRTGSKIAQYASAFDMRVIYFDPNVMNEEYKRCNTLEELLENSDAVSLHVHLSEETTGMINKQNISFFKKGSVLINTSRGGVIDEEVVATALKNKQLSGVATDVLSTELSNIRSSSLWKAQRDNQQVIITPHIGGATQDAMWACEEFIISLI